MTEFKNLEIYDIDPEALNELWGISLVDYPAIMTNWILQHKNDGNASPIIMADALKHEIISPILINGQTIYRCDESGEYYVRWTKESIERIALQMCMSLSMNNYTWGHEWFCNESGNKSYEETLLSGIHTLSMWIVEGDDDKIYQYGFDPKHVTEGSLCIHAKVTDNNLWKRIVSGEVRGFSIEGFVDYKRNE